MAEIKAKLQYLHIAPRKVRLVAGLIRGLDTTQALLILSRLPKRSSLPLTKLIQSAVTNATNNLQLSREGLYIKEIRVDQGTVLKRFMPRAFGRASPIRKKTSHVSLVLDTKVIGTTQRKRKKEGPIVREITKEDIREFEQKSKEGKDVSTYPRPKGRGFVQRMFRRKAI